MQGRAESAARPFDIRMLFHLFDGIYSHRLFLAVGN